MSSFEFFDNQPRRISEPALTVDKYGRIYLNRAAQELLGYEQGKRKDFYIGYDSTNKRIGLAKPEIMHLVDTRPVTFDAVRAYASVRGFLKHYNIYPDRTVRYIYVGKEQGTVFSFELEHYDAPDAAVQPEIKERKQVTKSSTTTKKSKTKTSKNNTKKDTKKDSKENKSDKITDKK